MKAALAALGTKLLNYLSNEPVTAWAGVLGLVLAALTKAGVPSSDIALATGILVLLGVPVVRGAVTPVAALRKAMGYATPLLTWPNSTSPGAVTVVNVSGGQAIGGGDPLIHDPAKHRIGALKSRHDDRTLQAGNYLRAAALPTVPTSTSRWLKIKDAAWGMLGNDNAGDCTIAGAIHEIHFARALAGKTTRISAATAIRTYSLLSGYDPATGANDTGLELLTVLNFWRKTGIGNHKIGAFAKVDLGNLSEIQACLYLFDGLYLALNLPLSAQRQLVWDVVPAGGANTRPGSWGGHCVNGTDTVVEGQTSEGQVLQITADGLVVITWGAPKLLTWAFLARYGMEAWAVLELESLNAKTGKTAENLDLATLQADLKGIAA